ncbi:hypothetical protein FKM82_018556 [Ascaphus truei]
MFKKVEEFLDQNSQWMEQLQRTVQMMTNQAPCIPTDPLPSVVSAPAARPINAASEPRLPTPNRYGGDPPGCRGFLNQCDIQFELMPSRFLSQRSKWPISYRC